MMRTTGIRLISILVVCGISVWGGNRKVYAENLNSVLRSPASYNGKRVTLTGIARGDFPYFELYADAAEALKMTAQKSISVFVPNHWRQTEPLNLRKVRISGVIDLGLHGTWGNPCGLRLENLDVVSGPVVPWPDVVAVFRNERDTPLLLYVCETKFEILPKKFIEVTPQDCVVHATSLEGSPVAGTRISKRVSKPFYDSDNAASYYRIRDGKIEMVLPTDAKTWGWRR